jgi:hypothetical protein
MFMACHLSLRLTRYSPPNIRHQTMVEILHPQELKIGRVQTNDPIRFPIEGIKYNIRILNATKKILDNLEE